jgi:tRNA threonylcarbamoyladenosine biosynthesis protein TsaB
MDARRNQLYNAIFQFRGGKLLRLCEDRMIEAPALAKELDAMDQPVYFIGDGYDIMSRMKLSYQKETPAACRWQNGYGVAMAALARYNETEDKSVFTDRLLRPEYLRLPQAERELKEKEAAKV